MTTIGSIIILVGSVIGLLAGIGLLRFSTPYARFHAAGKASPVAFLVAALGTAMTLDPAGAAYLGVAAAAMILTLPVGVHLLFRAVHRTTSSNQLIVDDFDSVPARAQPASRRSNGPTVSDG